jgi:phosphonate transport system permease protein
MTGHPIAESLAVAEFERRRAELVRAKRTQTLLFGVLFAAAILVSALIGDFYPSKLAAGLPRSGEYFQRILPTLAVDHLFDGPKVKGSIAYWFYRIDSWTLLLLETAQMAFLATLMGGIGAFLLSFLAAENTSPGWPVRFLARRLLEFFRTVPELVYALILVWAFGIGPIAGIFALTIHCTGALGKLFAEVIENIEENPLVGVRALGGNWLQIMRFGVVPQVLPNFASYLLLRFEINVRAASVIGFVGAGGIGQELYMVISQNYYEEISAIVLLIILGVALIDIGSERIRHGFIGRERLA